LPKQERAIAPRPKQERVCIEDATTEKIQEIMRDSPNGVLSNRDELSGWFGAMERYARQHGAHSDHAFWLQSYNGVRHTVDRIARGSLFIPHLGISVLGGIQPETLCQIAAGTADDGLIQRFVPIMLRPSTMSRDEAFPATALTYADLVRDLHALTVPDAPIALSDAAMTIRSACEAKHHDIALTYETLNKRFAAHIGKYDGMFARLCLLWHCIEAVERHTALPTIVTEDTARRVAAFMHGFMLPHAIAFYTEIFGLADNHDEIADVAGYILAHETATLTNRVMMQGGTGMRSLAKDKRRLEAAYHQLESLGWITRIPARRPSDPPWWQVNPEVHRLFAERAAKEREHRQRQRKIVAEVFQRQKQAKEDNT
jgi:hypothetical protein